MKTDNAKQRRFMRLASSLMAVTILVMSSVGQAHARILFEDDDYFGIQSEGIILDVNDNIAEQAAGSVVLTAGTSGGSATYLVTIGSDPGTTVSFNTDLATTAIDVAADITSNITGYSAVAIGTTILITADTAGTAGNDTVVTTLGGDAGTTDTNTTGGTDGGDIEIQFGNDGSDATITYDSTTQDVTLATPGGDFSFDNDNITTTGGAMFAGTSEFHIREVATVVSLTTPCTTTGEIALALDTDAIYVCTNAGTNEWKLADNNPADGTTDNAILKWDTGTSTWVEDTEFTVNIGTGAAGDLLYYNGTDWVNLAESSTPGYILSSNSDGTFSWVADQDTTIPNTDNQDFESVYLNDADNTLTASSTFDIDATGAIGIDSDAGVTIGGSTIGITADGVFTLTDGNDSLTFSQTSAGMGNDLLNAGGEIYSSTGTIGATIGGGETSTSLIHAINAVGTYAASVGAGAQDDIDDVYNNGASGTYYANVDTAATGYNITSTDGDAFSIQDTGVDFAEFSVDGSGNSIINFTPYDFDVDVTNAVSIDADAASNFTTSAGAITIDGAGGVNIAGNAAEIDVTTTGALDMNSGAWTWDGSTALLTSTSTFGIDSTGAVTIDSDASSTLSGAGVTVQSDGGALAITGDGTNDIDISNASAAIDMDADTLTLDTTGAFSLDGAAASNVTVAGANLTLSTTSSGDVNVTSAGQIVFDDAQLTGVVQMSVADNDWDTDFATDGIVDNVNDIATLLGADTISTFNFSEDNVLADDDAVYAALNKLDLKWGDLSSTANGEGASLVGVEDSAGYFTSTDVEGVLAELGADAAIEVEDLTFYPEWPDTSVYQDGSDNRGILESFYDAAQDTNYYNWTSSRVTLQDINIQFMFTLPPDFSAVGANGLQFEYRTGTATTTNNQVEFYMYERTGAGATTLCGSVTGLANGTGAGGAFAVGQVTKATIDGACTLTPGDVILIEAKLFDNNVSSTFADVGYVTLDYTR